MIRRRVLIRGFVQGIGFRFATAREAESRGVAGWVRNRPEGTVEAVFEGEADAVEALVRWCRQRPHGARVDGVDVVEEEPEGLRGFSVR